MEKKTLEILKALSSKTRVAVIEEVKNGREHPEDIARALELKRQSVDKHLLLLNALGIVERDAIFPPEGRPRILYRLSDAGQALLEDADELAERHWKRMYLAYLAEKRILDHSLIEGEISEEIYLSRLESMKRRYRIE